MLVPVQIQIDYGTMWKQIVGLIVFVVVVLWVILYGWTAVFNETSSEAIIDFEVDVIGQEVDTETWSSSRKDRMKKIPTVMMDLYQKGPHDVIPAEIVKSLTPTKIGSMQNKGTRIYNESFREHCSSIVFDIPGIIPGEELHSAELRLTLSFINWKQEPIQYTGVESRITIYFDSASEPLSQLVHFNQEEEVGLHFNCTQPLALFHRCNQFEGGILKLKISVKSMEDENLHPVITGSAVDRQPLLLLLYTPKVQVRKTQVLYDQRKKRNVDPEDYEEETNNVWSAMTITQKRTKPIKRIRNFCRRKPLYIDFSEIEYDSWIVAPNGYQAFQCSGRCVYPLSDHLSPTKHAIVQTLLHSISPMKAVRSCCVPTRLDSISVLYLDPHGVLTYRFSYKDMVVAECGCR